MKLFKVKPQDPVYVYTQPNPGEDRVAFLQRMVDEGRTDELAPRLQAWIERSLERGYMLRPPPAN